MEVVPGASVVKLARAAVPPTIPPNEVAPAVSTVKPNAPFNVEPNPILPEPVEVSTEVPLKVTGSL